MRTILLAFSVLAVAGVTLGCTPTESSVVVSRPHKDLCGKSIPPKGSPYLYKHTAIKGVTVEKARWCDQENPSPGHFIAVTNMGTRPFHKRPRGGCWLEPDGTWHDFKNSPGLTREACMKINTHGFLTQLGAVFKKRGIPTIGLGIHRCPVVRDYKDPGAWRRGVSIHDWQFANEAVKIVAELMQKWGISGSFDVRVREIPGACLL